MPVAQAPMTTQGVAPFVWGSNGAMLTPDQVAQQRQIAQAMIANAAAPQNVGEGLSAIGKALIARSMMDDANSAQATGQQSAAEAFGGLGDNPSLGTLEAAAGNPYLSDGQSSVVKAMLQQKLAQSDPAYQLDMAYKKAEMGQIGAIPGYQKMTNGSMQPIAGGPADPNNPQNSIELETKKAVLGIDQAKMQGGFYGDSDTAAAQRIVMTGDPGSKQYAMAYQFLYGPKTQTQITPSGLVPYTLQNPPPSGVGAPTYGGPVAPAGQPNAAPAPVGMPAAGGAASVAAPAPAPAAVAAGQQGFNGVQVIPGTRPASNESQQRNDTIGQILTSDLPTINANFDALADPKGQLLSKLPGGIGNVWQSEDYQRAANGVRASVSNILYSLSGASSNPGEVENQVAILTPQFGDKPATIADKKRRLNAYVQAVASAANDPQLIAKAQAESIAGMGLAGQNAPAKPITQADFIALPSGTMYIDPDDGKTYRKP